MPAPVSLTAFAGTPPPWSLAQLDANFANVASLLASVNNYATYLVDTGAANAYVVTLAAGTTGTLTTGLAVEFIAANDNTAASTLNVNGTGIVAITNPDGSALFPGQISAGQVVRAVYDGTQYKMSAQFDVAHEFIVGNAGTEGHGVAIAGTTYTSTHKVSDIGGSNLAQMLIHKHSTTLGPVLVMTRSNSNTAAHVDVVAGQDLGSIFGVGRAGADYKPFGAMQFFADNLGGISNTSSPGQWVLSLTPNASITPTAVITAKSDKSVAFAGALTLGGTVSGGGNQINNVVIGASTPLAGSFTTLSTTDTSTTSISSAGSVTSTVNGASFRGISPAGASKAGYVLTQGTTAGSVAKQGYFGVNAFSTDGSVDVVESGGLGLKITQGTGAVTMSGTLGVTGQITGSADIVSNRASSTFFGLSSNQELRIGVNSNDAIKISTGLVLTLPAYTVATFVAGDKYLVVDANGVIHRSAVGPAS